jgi:hypothetical protein
MTHFSHLRQNFQWFKFLFFKPSARILKEAGVKRYQNRAKKHKNPAFTINQT